jgi:hypothetical protein
MGQRRPPGRIVRSTLSSLPDFACVLLLLYRSEIVHEQVDQRLRYPRCPLWVGGSPVVAGGAITTFWKPA